MGNLPGTPYHIEMVQIENLPHQNGPEEIPEWVKDTVDNYEDFRRLCEVHCGNNEYMTNAMKNARRIWKSRAAFEGKRGTTRTRISGTITTTTTITKPRRNSRIPEFAALKYGFLKKSFF